MKNSMEVIIPLRSIPTIPAEPEAEGAGYKRTQQYFEHQLSWEDVPAFYKKLPHAVKISTLYIDTVAPLANGMTTGYEVFPEPDQHAHPEVYIPETGIIEFVYDDEHMTTKEQTQLVDHQRTEVSWDGEKFVGKIYMKENEKIFAFEWGGGLKEVSVPRSDGETETYSIFGIPPNVPHDVINRTQFLRNSITTIEFLPKD